MSFICIVLLNVKPRAGQSKNLTKLFHGRWGREGREGEGREGKGREGMVTTSRNTLRIIQEEWGVKGSDGRMEWECMVVCFSFSFL